MPIIEPAMLAMLNALVLSKGKAEKDIEESKMARTNRDFRGAAIPLTWRDSSAIFEWAYAFKSAGTDAFEQLRITARITTGVLVQKGVVGSLR